jgi:hypothetical protein
MRYDHLYLWFLADPAVPLYVGQLRLVEAGKGVSLQDYAMARVPKRRSPFSR